MEQNVQAEQIWPMHWVCLPHDLREHLAKVFGVGKSSYSEIVDNKIISDGRTPTDLKEITKEKMQEYINDKEEENFYRLWDICLSKARGELNPPKEIVSAPVDKSVDTVDKEKEKIEKVNPFREPTAKEKQVLQVLQKTQNGKATKTK